MKRESYHNNFGNLSIDLDDYYDGRGYMVSQGKDNETPLICLQYEFGGGITLSQKEIPELLFVLNRFLETGGISNE